MLNLLVEILLIINSCLLWYYAGECYKLKKLLTASRKENCEILETYLEKVTELTSGINYLVTRVNDYYRRFGE